MKNAKNVRRILVSVPTASYPERRKLEGILTYATEKRGTPWHVHIESSGGYVRQRLLDLPKWECDGIIAYVDTDRERKRILAARLPTVLVVSEGKSEKFRRTPRADTVIFANDHSAEGRAAARYFMARHFSHYAYLDSVEQTKWNQERRRGFVEELRPNGHACTCYGMPTVREQNDFAREMPRLTDWLASLPRPTALFIAHDARARQALIAAEAAGLIIPRDLAILSVDNDRILCETAVPALSSICTNNFSLGRACGRALEELISHRASGRVITTTHGRIITRASSDQDAATDPFVARALAYAARHLDQNPTAEDLAVRIGCSRRTLQARVRRTLGTTLGREIHRMRLDAARTLIRDTDRSLSEIAENCGFASASHLCADIKAAFGMTPVQLRQHPV